MITWLPYPLLATYEYCITLRHRNALKWQSCEAVTGGISLSRPDIALVGGVIQGPVLCDTTNPLTGIVNKSVDNNKTPIIIQVVKGDGTSEQTSLIQNTKI